MPAEFLVISPIEILDDASLIEASSAVRLPRLVLYLVAVYAQPAIKHATKKIKIFFVS